MSTTETKRTAFQAFEDARAFQALFHGCYDRWEFAGSVRRGKPEVGDIEHVVIPKMGTKPAGLFGTAEPTNLLLDALDAYVEQGVLAKHQYVSRLADGTERVSPRWGDTYRGVDFRGFNNEIFCATYDNWGAILAIRTGPAEYSHRVVTAMLRGGMYRQQGGGVIHVKTGERVKVPDEETFFRLAGVVHVRPEDRR